MTSICKTLNKILLNFVQIFPVSLAEINKRRKNFTHVTLNEIGKNESTHAAEKNYN